MTGCPAGTITRRGKKRRHRPPPRPVQDRGGGRRRRRRGKGEGTHTAKIRALSERFSMGKTPLPKPKFQTSRTRKLQKNHSGGPHSSYQTVVQGKCPFHFVFFEWGRLLEHSFLEHFCLDQFSVILGKFYMQDSRTPRLLEHFWVPILGASCSNKLFVGTVRPSQPYMPTKNLIF